jgi:hypothetical protein
MIIYFFTSAHEIYEYEKDPQSQCRTTKFRPLLSAHVYPEVLAYPIVKFVFLKKPYEFVRSQAPSIGLSFLINKQYEVMARMHCFVKGNSHLYIKT